MSRLLVVLCSLAVVEGSAVSARAQEQAPPASEPNEPAPKIPNDQLDSLVAPIALYPDPLLAQVLAASTYPLEIVQLGQWLGQHGDLKDQALMDAVQQQDWDPSVQALAAFPDVVKLLANDIKWTTQLGDVFLAQESDVMQAVQRMRAKAKENGQLKSNDQMKVETKTVQNEPIIIIEQASPQVVYVPSYDPAVVYGPPVYPYPAIAYPTAGYVAGAAISFGVGVAVGAAFHGGWGYGVGWGGAHGNTINVNRNNTFVRNSATRTGGEVRAGNRGQWQHNPQHRGGAPYRNQATASRYGGTTARDTSRAQRAGGAGQQPGGRGGVPNRQPAAEGRAGGAPSARAAERGGGAAAGGGDRVGNRSVAPSSGGGSPRGGDALGGGSRGSYNGSNARSSSARGSSSMGSRGTRSGAPRGGGRGGGRRR
jgi:hypothetical protein